MARSQHHLVRPGRRAVHRLRHARRLRPRRRRAAPVHPDRRGAPAHAQLHRPGLGRQRGLAGHRRRRAVRRVSRGLRHGLLRLLPGLHAAAGRADLPRGGHRVPQQAADALVAADVGRRLRRRQHALEPADRRGHGQHRLGHAARRRGASSPAPSSACCTPTPCWSGSPRWRCS